MKMKTYTLENAMRFLGETGLANKIMESRGDFEISLRKLRNYPSTTKHRYHGDRNQDYYRYVVDHIRTVISLTDDDSTNCVEATSKYLKIGEEAVEKFWRGWAILVKTVRSTA